MDNLSICGCKQRNGKACSRKVKYKNKNNVIGRCGHHSRYKDDFILYHDPIIYDNERCSFNKCNRISRRKGSTCDRHRPKADLSFDQKLFVKVAKSGKNVWLYGKAGTGKSHVTRYIIDSMNFRKKKVASTGATGVAASNIDGHTLHYLLGNIGHGQYRDDDDIIRRLVDIDILVIDEISMVGAALFSNADKRLRDIRGIDKPFGGIQIIVVGDFKQLPPVNDNFCDRSVSWKECGFTECELIIRHRSSDGKLNDLLDFARDYKGTIAEFKKEIILKKFKVPVENAISLYATNKEVNENVKIPKNSICYNSIDKGNKEILDKFTRLRDRVNVWIGAKVMCIINDRKQRLFNGQRGDVVRINGGAIDVKFPTMYGHRVVAINRITRTVKIGDIYHTRSQFPLIPGDHMTIHKSQGLSLPSLIVDLSKATCMRMVYVALSRATCSKGLRIITDRRRVVTKDIRAYFNT